MAAKTERVIRGDALDTSLFDEVAMLRNTLTMSVASFVVLLPGCASQTHNLTDDDAGSGGQQSSCLSGMTCGAGAPSGGTSTVGGGGTGPRSACPPLGEAECRANTSCRSLTDTQGRFYGCIEDRECGDVTTCAANGSTVVLFSTTCIPDHYIEVGAERCTPTDCAALTTAAECNAAAGCTSLVSTDGRFWECRRGTCGDTAMTCARPSSGEVAAYFPTTCIPTGWTAVDTSLCGDAISCAGWRESQCLPSTRCEPIRDLWGRFRGCGPRGKTCPAATMCASNGEITTTFPSGCVPDGYTFTSSTDACAGPSVSKGVGLYLVEGITTTADLSYQKFDLAGVSLKEPALLEDSEIASYDPTAHVFDLTLSRSDLFARVGTIGVYGTPFVLTADGVRVLGGWFWTPISSVPCHECITVQEPIDGIDEPLAATQIRLDDGYPAGVDPTPDPRNDAQLIQCLGRDGKLGG